MANVTLVTGASGSLAMHVREHFAQQGATLALFERDPSHAAVSRARGMWACDVDLMNEEAIEDAIARLETDVGPIAHAVLLAGGFAMQDAQAADRNSFEAMLARNLFTAVNVTRALLPRMLSRQQGVVAGVAAAAAIQGGARMGAYAASKAALATYLRAIDHELRPQGVRTLTLVPMGTIASSASDEASDKLVNPGALAATLWHHLANDEGAKARELRVAPGDT